MGDDSVSSTQPAPILGRREFLVTSILAAGTFAAAVQPIQGQTQITTDDHGLSRVQQIARLV